LVMDNFSLHVYRSQVSRGHARRRGQ
jgi:hypothetical protein